MRPAFKYSLLPVIVGVSALFAVLPQRGADATVRIVRAGDGFAYTPGAVKIEAGQRVAFVNDSKQTHTATCDGCPWTSGDIQPSQTKFVTFETDAATSFACIYHPDDERLKGTLVVGSPRATPSPTPSPSA